MFINICVPFSWALVTDPVKKVNVTTETKVQREGTEDGTGGGKGWKEDGELCPVRTAGGERKLPVPQTWTLQIKINTNPQGFSCQKGFRTTV